MITQQWDILKSALPSLVKPSKPPCSAVVLYTSYVCIWHFAYCMFWDVDLKTKQFGGLEARLCVSHVSSHHSTGIFEEACKKPW